MKKNTILQTIAKQLVRNGRICVRQGAHCSSLTSALRLLVFFFLLMLGVGDVWGHNVVDGVYYIYNNNTAGAGGSWYLWPAITVTKDGSNYLYSYKYLTTHDGIEAEAVTNNNGVSYPAHDNTYCHWVVKNISGGYIQLINPKLNKYVVIQKNHSLNSGQDVMFADEPTGTDVNYSYFVLNNSSNPYKISPPSDLSTVTYVDGKNNPIADANSYSFNSKNGNDRTWLTWSDAGTNKPAVGENIKGVIQFFSDGTPQWYFTSAPLVAPTVTMDDDLNKVTVTENNGLPKGYKIRYTFGVDGTQDPPIATTTDIIGDEGYEVLSSGTIKVVIERYGVVLTNFAPLAIEPIAIKPQISYNSSDHKVTIESATEGNTIYYTTDGATEPDPNNAGGLNETQEYDPTDKVTISGKTTIKARATKSDRRNSNVATMTIYYDPVTLSAASATYDGTDKTPTVNVKDGETDIESSKYTVKYKNSANEEVTEFVNAGTYTVVVEDVDGDDEIVCGTATFTIDKITITPSVSIENWTYKGTASTPNLTGNVAGGAVTYEFKVKDADDNTYTTTVPTEAGNYTIRVTVAETANSNGGTSTADFTILPKSLSSSDINIDISKSGSNYSVTVTEGEDALTVGTHYTLDTENAATSGIYYTIPVIGANNYTGTVTAKYANVNFDTKDNTNYFATFVSNSSDGDFVNPSNITPYIITGAVGNALTAVALDYIPENVPVVLLTTTAAANGFCVKVRSEGVADDTSSNLLEASSADMAVTVATVYLLYKGEFVLNAAGTLAAGKVYLPKAAVESANSPAPARLTIRWDEYTGIENVQASPPHVQLSADWYTLDGRRLIGKPTRKGLYLQNGQKMAVK